MCQSESAGGVTRPSPQVQSCNLSWFLLATLPSFHLVARWSSGVAAGRLIPFLWLPPLEPVRCMGHLGEVPAECLLDSFGSFLLWRFCLPTTVGSAPL